MLYPKPIDGFAFHTRCSMKMCRDFFRSLQSLFLTVVYFLSWVLYLVLWSLSSFNLSQPLAFWRLFSRLSRRAPMFSSIASDPSTHRVDVDAWFFNDWSGWFPLFNVKLWCHIHHSNHLIIMRCDPNATDPVTPVFLGVDALELQWCDENSTHPFPP
jgi:hypothetical protein